MKYTCVIFTTAQERGSAQESRKISLKQQHEAKEMEALFFVEYDDDYWLRDLCGANSSLPKSCVDCLVEGEGRSGEFEAGM